MILAGVALSFRSSISEIVVRTPECQPQAVKSCLFRVVALALADYLVVGTFDMPVPESVAGTLPDLCVHTNSMSY